VLENPVPVTVRVVPPVVGPEVGEINTRVKADPDLVAFSSVAVVFTLLREGLQAAEKARIRIPKKDRPRPLERRGATNVQDSISINTDTLIMVYIDYISQLLFIL
jgi:hypothetical protein